MEFRNKVTQEIRAGYTVGHNQGEIISLSSARGGYAGYTYTGSNNKYCWANYDKQIGKQDGSVQ
jgi:hypothetical protein